MFHMKYLFYFICIRWIVAIPQLNLYFTNEVSEGKYDEIGVRYTCLRLIANMKHASPLREISSYCISESSSKFHIENEGNSFEKFYFEDLAKKNISSEELYLWSTPIDIIEQYEIYLELNESSLGKQIVYNCTLPKFGSMCQYELYYYHEKYSSLNEIIYDYYQSYPYTATTNLTCYTHLKCNRGYAPACLDWTEICDGKVDCLDGEYDEEHCWEFELNECKQNEHQCSLGQCIPYEFVHDDPDHPDCLDTNDENMNRNYLTAKCNFVEPIIACEDIRCQSTFFTSSCVGQRNSVLIESMFSIKDISASDECWSAFKCYFAFSLTNSPQGNNLIIEEECMPIIKEKCPDMLYVPNIPTFFGHVYTAYKKNDRPYVFNFIFPYLCSNKSFYPESLELVSDISLNNTKCYKAPRFDSVNTLTGSGISRYRDFMNNIFLILRKHNPIINFPRNQCNSSIVYQCINSSKCISYYRLMNGVTDCPYNDDENAFEDTNPHISSQLKYNYYKCHFTNKYILQSAIFNGQCDCGHNENSFCEDEHAFDNFTHRTISFQTICDIHTELYPITIDKLNHTDETECQQWECNNIYTRCDNVWNCLNGEDEINCDSPLLFNCSSDYRTCVTLDTYKLTCLPVKKINDDQVDCFGDIDERKLCMIENGLPDNTLYCMNSNPKTCIHPKSYCTDIAYCPYKDDEEFCQKNQSIPIYHSICNVEYTSFRSNFEMSLCDISKYKRICYIL